MGKVIHIHVHKKATKDTLQGGTSKAAFSHNVKTEVAAGKPVKQAVAIAYRKQRETNDAPDTSKGHWITINGTHVQVSEGGKITAGPADLKKALEHHKSEAKKHEKTNEPLSEAHNNARRSLAAASQVPEAEHAQIRQYWTKHAETNAKKAAKIEQSSKKTEPTKPAKDPKDMNDMELQEYLEKRNPNATLKPDEVHAYKEARSLTDKLASALEKKEDQGVSVTAKERAALKAAVDAENKFSNEVKQAASK